MALNRFYRLDFACWPGLGAQGTIAFEKSAARIAALDGVYNVAKFLVCQQRYSSAHIRPNAA